MFADLEVGSFYAFDSGALDKSGTGYSVLVSEGGFTGTGGWRVWLILGIDIEYIPGDSFNFYEEPSYEFCDGTFGWKVRLDNSTTVCVTGVEWTWIAYYSKSELENGIQSFVMSLYA